MNSKAGADQRSEQGYIGCWKRGHRTQRLVSWAWRTEWESLPGKARGRGSEGCWALRQPDTCSVSSQIYLKDWGTEPLLWRCLKLPGLMSCFPGYFGSVTRHLCLQQVERKAECEPGSPEASEDHGSLPGGASLIEWAVFSGSGEGSHLEGRRKGRTAKVASGGRIRKWISFKKCHMIKEFLLWCSGLKFGCCLCGGEGSDLGLAQWVKDPA